MHEMHIRILCDAFKNEVFWVTHFYDVSDTADDNIPLLWRHTGRDGVSNHQPHDCLLKGSFKRR